MLCRATALFALVALAACSGFDPLASEALSVSEEGTSEAHLIGDAADPEVPTDDPVAAATSVAGRIGERRADCATVTQDGPVLTIVLDACTGRFGRRAVTGTIVSTFSSDAAGLIVDSASTGLQIGEAVVDHTWHSVLSDVDGIRTLTTHGEGSGTDEQGRAFSRVADHVLSKDAAGCRAVDGHFERHVGERSAETTVTAFVTCPDSCPNAGGLVEHRGLGGREITLSFDGTASAHFEISNGREGDIDLACDGGDRPRAAMRAARQ